MIGHTQPRRIAARTVAAANCFRTQQSSGSRGGLQGCVSPIRLARDTYIKLMTDGILLAEIQGDHTLSAYDTIIIDEAHERSLILISARLSQAIASQAA